MIFINNSSHISLDLTNQPETYQQPVTGELVIDIGTCLNMLPAKQLGLFLRTSFLLRSEELQKKMTPARFKEFVEKLVMLLLRLEAQGEEEEITEEMTELLPQEFI
jgi:hypothetical protein